MNVNKLNISKDCEELNPDLKELYAKNKKSKYNNEYTILDGIKFQSIKEANRYVELKRLKLTGEIKFFLMQVPFMLPGNIKYLLDFLVIWENGSITYEDVKGHKTQVYINKKKQVESLYPIKITEL